ncbi:MAG: nucleoside triphosphate pyrophosphohydrolase [candidate division WOR-3 bacterium]
MRVVRRLRKECPWDRRQTLSSSRPLVLNEAFELDEALRKRDSGAIAEELGDYLFMGLFLGQVLEETRGIKLQKVLKGVVQKLKARHPHVYGDVRVKGVDEVLANWERIKRRGKKGSILAGLPRALPALQQAQLIQERCRRVGFDWSSAREVLSKVEEEVGELKGELRSRRANVKEELGDLLFAVVNLCRHLGVDAEGALKDANEKFRRRFEIVEQEFARQGRPLSQVSLEEMERVWQHTKRCRAQKRRSG